MPILAALPAALAIGVAATSIATVGLTVATGFAIAAAVGATLAAVGHYTGIKELKIAGTILGIVGGIGGLAAGAGLFASTAAEGAGLASGAAAGGSGMTGVTPLASAGSEVATAVDAGNAALAQGGTIYRSSADITGALSSAGLPAETSLSHSADVIAVLNGAAPTDVPVYGPEMGAGQGGPAAGEVGGLTGEGVGSSREAIRQTARNVLAPPEPGAEFQQTMTPEEFTSQPGQGLVNDPGTNVAGDAVPTTDQFGRQIEMGGGQNRTLGTTDNYYETQVAGEAPSGKPGDAGPQPDTSRTTAATQQTGGNQQTTTQATGTTQAGGTTQATGGASITKTGSTQFDPDEGIFGKLLKFMEKNSNLTIGTLMGASSFISGALKGGGGSAAEADYYAAAAERNRAAAELDRMRRANAEGPFPQMVRPIGPLTSAGLIQDVPDPKRDSSDYARRRKTSRTPSTVTGRVEDINDAVTGQVNL